MIYLVLGMHKSGTTLVSNLLHHAGINMVETAQGNYEDDGFYERESSYQMNLKLLGIPPDMLELHPAPQRIQFNTEYQQEIQAIIQENCEKYSDWGFKDPRSCLVYPAWEQYLPEHKLLVVYRPIEDIWPRFQYSGMNIWKHLSHAILLVQRWYDYNQHILDILNKTEMAYIVLSYPELMNNNSELQRLRHFLGKDIVDVREKLHKMHSGSSLFLSIAKWLIALKEDYHYQRILDALEDYRHEQGNPL